jgi:hypothetical protein
MWERYKKKCSALQAHSSVEGEIDPGTQVQGRLGCATTLAHSLERTRQEKLALF